LAPENLELGEPLIEMRTFHADPFQFPSEIKERVRTSFDPGIVSQILVHNFAQEPEYLN
jgi:hypothetical protein